MNFRAIWAIYYTEMARTARTLMQSVASPVLSTSLYFVVFGGAIGSRIPEIEGISYGAFIVPGLIMLTLLTQSTANASFGIYFPKFIGTIYELLSAPVSYLEIVIGFVGAAATKSIILGVIILVTATFFVDVQDRASAGDGPVPGADLAHLQPPRLHHRHLGQGLRAAPDRAAPHHHAARLPRRHLLLDRHAAAVLADRDAVQPGGLPGQRLPLELLQPRPTSTSGSASRRRWASSRSASPSSPGSSGPAIGSRCSRRRPIAGFLPAPPQRHAQRFLSREIRR